LPIGTSRAAAESWLRGRGIRFDAAENKQDAPGGWKVPAEAGAAARQIGSTVVARVEPTFVDLFGDGAMDVWLYFDADGKLTGYGFILTEHAS
jgi:hypothetical protein